MKALLAILIVLVLLGGGLVVADRVARSYAENLVAQHLTSELRLSQQPQVQIDGTPFLTQWASGDYQKIEIQMASVTAQSITVEDIQATVENVHAKEFLTSGQDVGQAVAGSVTLTGQVPLSQIPLPSGFTAKASGSQLAISGSITVLGATFPVTALEKITVSGSTVTFTPTDVQVSAGPLTTVVSGELTKQLGRSFDLGDLPFSVQVTSITVANGSLQVTATGQNVPLSQS